MKVQLLADHPDYLPTLGDWFRREWEPYYGPDGPGDAEFDLKSRCNRDTLPMALIALDADQVLGTAALDEDVTTNLTPSVVGLLVAPEYRRRGAATALFEAAEDIARRLGHRQIYTSSSVLGELLNRRGWRVMGETRFLNDEEGQVYCKDLD